MAKSEFTTFAPAKINLTLRVLGKRPDGYHELDSLVVFADVGDRMRAVRSHDWTIEIDGPFASDLNSKNSNDNLVLRAAKLVQVWASANGIDLAPLHFHLEKNLPVASGIGGGSSDAAAAIRLCLQSANLQANDSLMEAMANLGADIPVCFKARPSWMSGMGEKLSEVCLPDGLALVLVNPGVGVSTADVFRRLDAGAVTTQNEDHPDFSTPNAFLKYLAASRNDLESSAIAIEPMIQAVLTEISNTGAILTRMSGSGATCFGIYDSRANAEKAASSITEKHSDWWVKAANF